MTTEELKYIMDSNPLHLRNTNHCSKSNNNKLFSQRDFNFKCIITEVRVIDNNSSITLHTIGVI